MIYRCTSCGEESSMTEQTEPVCRYCRKKTLELVSQEPVTAEGIARRMKAAADRMMKVLADAYDAKPDDDETDEDMERRLLELMARAKTLRDHVHSLELRERAEEE